MPDDDFLTGPKTKEHWDPDFQNLVSPLSTPASNLSYKRKKCIIDDPADYIDMSIPIVWSLNDLVLASRLLVGGGSEKQCSFSDEYETRRVYSMIFDVFRCKYSNHLYTMNALISIILQTSNCMWNAIKFGAFVRS